MWRNERTVRLNSGTKLAINNSVPQGGENWTKMSLFVRMGPKRLIGWAKMTLRTRVPSMLLLLLLGNLKWRRQTKMFVRKHGPRGKVAVFNTVFSLPVHNFLDVAIVSSAGKRLLSVADELKKSNLIECWILVSPRGYLGFLSHRLLFHRRHMQDIWNGLWIAVSMSWFWINLCRFL